MERSIGYIIENAEGTKDIEDTLNKLCKEHTPSAKGQNIEVSFFKISKENTIRASIRHPEAETRVATTQKGSLEKASLGGARSGRCDRPPHRGSDAGDSSRVTESSARDPSQP